MKNTIKIVIVVCLLMVGTNVFSQMLLGYTFDAIKKHFEDRGTEIRIKNLEEEKLDCILVYIKDDLVVYYFKEGKRCDVMTINPDNQASLNRLVKLYNSKCIIISATQWRSYLIDGFIYDIHLSISSEKIIFYMKNLRKIE